MAIVCFCRSSLAKRNTLAQQGGGGMRYNELYDED